MQHLTAHLAPARGFNDGQDVRTLLKGQGSVSDFDPSLYAEELGKLEILSGVSPAAVFGVLERCTLKQLEPGECLLTKGGANRHIYFVLQGRLAIHLDDPDAEPIAFLDVGQTVGEMSVLDPSPASAHVIAVEPTRLIEVDDVTFWRLIGASHQFAINLLLVMSRRMRANNTNLHRAHVMHRELERDAAVDALTGLFNRRTWDEKFGRLVTRSQRAESPLSLLVIDVDHFKRYNDDFGHAAGDEVLKTLGRVLSDHLRPTDLAARFGGEEFVVALPATDLEGALCAAERIRRAIQAAVVSSGKAQPLPRITVSIGAAVDAPGQDGPALFQRADAALYRAKAAGRDRVES